MIISLGTLVIAFAGLLVHISAGGTYETRTIAAMIFRMTVNAVLVWILYPPKKAPTSALVKAVDVHNHHVAMSASDLHLLPPQ